MVKWAGLELDHVFLSLSLGGWSLVRGVAIKEVLGFYHLVAAWLRRGVPRMLRGLGCRGASDAAGTQVLWTSDAAGPWDAVEPWMLRGL